MKANLHGMEEHATLLAWWLDELAEAEANEVEEHLFGCDVCEARLRELLALRNAMREALLHGQFGTAVSAQFIERLKGSGLRVREYRVPAGGSVACTVTPQDDLAVSHLEASLTGVRQLDIVFEDDRGQQRAARIPFDAAANEVTFIPPVAVLRRLNVATQRMKLLAVTPDSERLIGEYTFNHSRWVA
jgi:anti-sigma factor RsiW